MSRISWKNEFDKADKERMDLARKVRKEQLRSLVIELAMGCENERWLRNAVTFMATLQDKEVRESNGNLFLAEKGGVA